MEEKRAIYDKVSISIRALSIFIVLGLFMTALVIGYGAFLGNSGSGLIPVSGKDEKAREREEEVFNEKARTQKDNAETEKFEEGLE